jgi:hypothetical protein
MRNAIRDIILIMTAAFVMSGCEMNDSGRMKILPPGSVPRTLDADAALKSLSVENFSISPAYDPEVLDYTLVVSKATTPSLTVRAIAPEGADVTVSINGEEAVPVSAPGYAVSVALDDAVDSNDIVMAVTSENGKAAGEYHLRVYYLGTSASLSGLSVGLTNGSPGAISGDLAPLFDPANFSYTVGISFATTSIDITVSIPEGSGMTVTVDGWSAVSGVAVPITNLPAASGSRAISITVKSQDLGTTKNYTITVSKGATPSAEARLKYLDRAVKVWGVWNDIDNFGPEASQANLAVSWLYESKDGGWLFSSISDYRFYLRPIDASIQGITVNGTACEVVQVDGIETYRCILSRSSFSGYNIALPIVITAESGDTMTYTLTIKD